MRSGLFIAGSARSISDANRTPTAGESASRAATDARSQMESLRLDVEKLFMITEALWAVLKDRHGYTDEQLGQMIQDIDLRDGRLDGKVARQPNPNCPQCNRPLLGKHPVCLYCGTPVSRDPFER